MMLQGLIHLIYLLKEILLLSKLNKLDINKLDNDSFDLNNLKTKVDDLAADTCKTILLDLKKM